MRGKHSAAVAATRSSEASVKDEIAHGLMVEIAKTIGLDSKGQDRKQQMPRQVRRRRSLENALPPGAQPLEIEIAQMRDLVFYRDAPDDLVVARAARCLPRIVSRRLLHAVCLSW